MKNDNELVRTVLKLELVAVDIDGVLTDGHGILDDSGNEQKRISYRDLDAIAVGRNLGLDFLIVTAENNQMVDIIARRFGIDAVLKGAKNKKKALMDECNRRKVRSDHVCYIGDSDRDQSTIDWAGLGVSPSDGSKAAKVSAKVITDCNGGEGVLAEVVELIREIRSEFNGKEESSRDKGF